MNPITRALRVMIRSHQLNALSLNRRYWRQAGRGGHRADADSGGQAVMGSRAAPIFGKRF
jgi:hypothetical protein